MVCDAQSENQKKETRKETTLKVVNEKLLYSSADRRRINAATNASGCKSRTLDIARNWLNLQKQRISGHHARVQFIFMQQNVGCKISTFLKCGKLMASACSSPYPQLNNGGARFAHPHFLSSYKFAAYRSKTVKIAYFKRVEDGLSSTGIFAPLLMMPLCFLGASTSSVFRISLQHPH